MKSAPSPLVSSKSPPQFRLRFPLKQIGFWASRYPVESDDQVLQQIVPSVQCRGYLSKKEFLVVCRWKTPRSGQRCAANDARDIEEATRIAFSAESESLRIGVLMVLEGVGLPTASVILHFCHRDPYPILDYRALWSLGVYSPPSAYRFSFWWAYVEACRCLCRQAKASMRSVDRALWQYSKEHQPT